MPTRIGRTARRGKVADSRSQSALGTDRDAPRWLRIAEEFAAAIERGAHPEGTSLPPAATIAARHGVHRHTARQAYRHLQDLGLVSVERGRGTIVQGRRFPYRLGRRVSLRANFGAAGLDVEGLIIESRMENADVAMAKRLAVQPGAQLWSIRTLNSAAGVPVSTGVHWLSVARFPDFDRRLAASKASITAAFASYGVRDYVRLETRLSARLASKHEAKLLCLAKGAPVLQSIALDGLDDGTPLQAIEGVFSGPSVEMVIAPAT